MFSLGIILFEMRRRFDTGMERAQAILALRQRSQLPADFASDGANAQFGRVILQLVDHDPTRRVSCLAAAMAATGLLRKPPFFLFAEITVGS